MIRLVLFIVFFLWVVKAPFAYRDSIRDTVLRREPEVSLLAQDHERTQLFIQASQNYKAGDPRRTKAETDLAVVRWQRFMLDDAEKLYRAAIQENKPMTGFDQTLEETMMRFGDVLIAQKKLSEAELCYGKVLEYDKKYFAKNDSRFGRDYNNLGMVTYLEALGKDRGTERIRLLKLANDFYRQALQIYNLQPKTEQAVAVVLYNEHLALRDLDDADGARLAKGQAASI